MNGEWNVLKITMYKKFNNWLIVLNLLFYFNLRPITKTWFLLHLMQSLELVHMDLLAHFHRGHSMRYWLAELLLHLGFGCTLAEERIAVTGTVAATIDNLAATIDNLAAVVGMVA